MLLPGFARNRPQVLSTPPHGWLRLYLFLERNLPPETSLNMVA